MPILRMLGIVTTILFFLSVFTPLWNVIGAQIEMEPALGPADAIVVLGAGMDGPLLNAESLRRAVYGIGLYKRELAPLLVLSGPADAKTPDLPEAEVRKELAIEMGISAEHIRTLTTVLTTRDEAQQTAAGVVRNSGTILLVTGSLHMRRAARVFERSGFTVLAAPSDDYPHVSHRPGARLQLSRYVLEQGLGLIYYKIFGYL